MTTTAAGLVPEDSKRALLAGLLTRAELEAETSWSWRTVLRREAEGLPVIKIGATKLYPADKVRAWILSHERRRETPRRGRPKAA